MTKFLREEVYRAKAERWLGPVRLAAPLGLWFFAILGAAVILGFLTLLLMGRHKKILWANGQVVPVFGIAASRSPEAGWTKHIFVADGDYVQPGDKLIEIDTDKSSADYGATGARMHTMQEAQLSELSGSSQLAKRNCDYKLVALQAKLTVLVAQREKLNVERGMFKRQVRVDEGVLNRFQALVNEGYVSQLQISEQLNQLLRAKIDMADLDLRKSQLEASILDIRYEIAQAPIQCQMYINDFSQRERELEAQMAENATHKGVILRATQAGLVRNITTQVGAVVTVNEHLLDIVPRSEVFTVDLWLPAGGVGLVREGQSVRLSFNAYPDQRYGQHHGVVKAIAETPLAPADFEKLTGLSSNNLMYRVSVELGPDSISRYLVAGEPVRGGITVANEPLFGNVGHGGGSVSSVNK